jgi:deoxyribodipyrimidine photo-lyase
MRALVWFRSDLRVLDNTALHHACKAADKGVLAVFAICAKQWAEHDWGAMKVDFVLRSVRALSETLAKLNIPLLVARASRFTTLPGKLLRLAAKHECDALFFNREYEVNEQRRDTDVTALFERHGRSVHKFTDQVILDVAGMRTGSGGFYTVFTPFKRKWLELLEAEDPPRVRGKPRHQPRLPAPPDDVPTALRGFAGGGRPDLWPEGEAAARRRLRTFVSKRIDRYHELRDMPAVDGTSTLSPYLAAGVLSSRQCLHAAMEANRGRAGSGKKGVTTWIGELMWREFYRHILIGFPQVCLNRPFRLETERLPWRYDEGQFEAWCTGHTGVPIVDAGMRQLAETGWMHNRVRMIAAMFLTKDLFIDWRWGERHFMRHLVDGDFASNNGGWQWSASTGTDAAPYFRIFNPFSQSRRFDPKGDYIRRFVPELDGASAGEVHEPHKSESLGADYPRPSVDHDTARRMTIKAFQGLSRKGITRSRTS